MTRPILVGIDGSEESMFALDWALAEATSRGLPLQLVHAVDLRPYGAPSHIGALYSEENDARLHARHVLKAARERAATVAPNVAVTAKTATTRPAAALIKASTGAGMVVLGARGGGGFEGLLLGAVAAQVAAHAACPVVVVRNASVQTNEVVVGVDGSPLSEAAVAFAFDHASRYTCKIVALHAWPHPVSTGPGDEVPFLYDVDKVAEEETRLLAEAIAGHRDTYPDVDLVPRVVHAAPARALVEASAHADMVVVGSRGRGGFASMLLGSVSHIVLRHAACTVAVVR